MLFEVLVSFLPEAQLWSYDFPEWKPAVAPSPDRACPHEALCGLSSFSFPHTQPPQLSRSLGQEPGSTPSLPWSRSSCPEFVSSPGGGGTDPSSWCAEDQGLGTHSVIASAQQAGLNHLHHVVESPRALHSSPQTLLPTPALPVPSLSPPARRALPLCD